MLCEVISRIGWARLNQGLEVREVVGTSAGGFPLVMSPVEARLFDGLPGVRRAFSALLVTAIGCPAAGESRPRQAAGAVTQFRDANVVHAEVLGDFLDVAPLTRVRLARLLSRMDRLVSAFVALFGQPGGAAHDEAERLRDVYDGLRARIDEALSSTTADPVPLDVCRLVLPFEDPTTPAAVRTLHGLKRYLHQRGLKLAFALIGAGLQTTRTIDLAVVADGRVGDVTRRLEFIDLEGAPDTGGEAPPVPHSVRLVADAFAMQLLHAQRIASDVRVFCYGSEVHYFARFRNHPAFIRIDYSPPLRGGMVDLQYLGVSNSELDVHPCVTLDAIRHLFERLDFIVEADATRIHARYDKERAVTLDQLHDRAARLFSLVPYLMDLDWTIGSLPLSADARRQVAEAWAGFFVRHGVLPYDQFLTRDRSAVLAGVEADAGGPRDVVWTGDGPYRDRFSVPAPPELAGQVSARLDALGIRVPARLVPADLDSQLAVEARVLRPLRGALARGQVEATDAGLRSREREAFAWVADAAQLAFVIESPPAAVARAASLARVAPLVERHTPLRVTGRINGHPVRRARLPLGLRSLTICVLEDGAGVPRLACATWDEGFWRRRDDPDGAWVHSPGAAAEDVLDQLRAANVLGALPDAPPIADDDLAADVRRTFRTARALPASAVGPGEAVAAGVAASPGRATGLLRFRAAGREPADLEGAIFCAAGLEPRDAPFLVYAAAVAATGGGILSHLGLLAAESGKPALIVDGAFAVRRSGETVLTFATPVWEESACDEAGWHLVDYRHLSDTEHEARDGDLVTLDADQGQFVVFSAEPEALLAHESLRQHAAACARLAAAAADDLLVERGHYLRTRHQMQKALARPLAAPVVRMVAEELLLNAAWTDDTHAQRDGGEVLRGFAARPETGAALRMAVAAVVGRLAVRVRDARDTALRLLPSCTTFHDALALRGEAARAVAMLRVVGQLLDRCGLDPGIVQARDTADVDRAAAGHLVELRRRYEAGAVLAAAPAGGRQRLREIARLDDLLAAPPAVRRRTDAIRAAADARDAAVLERVATRIVLKPQHGGAELAPLVGAKAANLAEAAQVTGPAMVPPWFALTSRALRLALQQPVPAGAAARRGRRPPQPARTLGDTIAAIAQHPGMSPAARAAAIHELWEQARLPDAVVSALTTALRDLGPETYVAIRSSASDEDTEQHARAGQFDTFLFVRGLDAVQARIRQAWAGFWNARALHDRDVRRAADAMPEGGLVVQRMVMSRVSGVMQTINVADRHPLEMVINVGLGLGEGIVSGTVAADHVVVAKAGAGEGDPPFRYVTADKRQRVVFDERFGQGTIRADTLAHQRLRPALEYQELRQLIELALRLERAFGHPLDLEFGFEGDGLHLLQVRPVPAALAVWRDAAAAGVGWGQTRPL